MLWDFNVSNLAVSTNPVFATLPCTFAKQFVGQPQGIVVSSCLSMATRTSFPLHSQAAFAAYDDANTISACIGQNRWNPLRHSIAMPAADCNVFSSVYMPVQLCPCTADPCTAGPLTAGPRTAVAPYCGSPHSWTPHSGVPVQLVPVQRWPRTAGPRTAHGCHLAVS